MSTGRPWLRRLGVGDATFEVDLRLEGDRLVGRVVGPDGEETVAATVHRASGDDVAVRSKGHVRWATVVRRGHQVHVALDGHVFVLEEAEVGGDHGHRAADEPFATSPMTGTVVKVTAVAGARVAKGGELFVVEAMKMEFVVRAPRDVAVAEVRRKAGERVDLGEVVVTYGDGA